MLSSTTTAAGMEICGAGLTLFSDAERYKIHLASLDILWTYGIKIVSKEAREIFEGAGCIVDHTTEIVKIPAHIVEDAIHSAPGNLHMYGRDPENDILLEDKRVHFAYFSTAPKVIDPYSREIRDPLLKDVEHAAKIADALDEVALCNRVAAPTDVPAGLDYIENMAVFFKNNTKPLNFAASTPEQFEFMYRMAVTVAGSEEDLKTKPLFLTGGCAISPLIFPAETCDVYIAAARKNVPVKIVTMGMLGGTNSVHMASGIAHTNAEILAGLTLVQLVNKGNPVLYGTSNCSLDMKTGLATVGSPETALISCGMTKMAQYYQLPSYIAGG